ncbi:thioesterase II family protein [Paenibacillus polymyxa]|uniref:thioesterase II family protein n=1 Tax=Paenibacillus polymyxa TaxID=1406 RepID=UPI0032169EE0
METRFEAGKWLCCKHRLPKEQVKLRLFLFPPAGSDIAIYQRWEEYLPAEMEICLICLPGRGVRMNERLVDDCNVLVENMLESIQDYLDIPYVLFGHSLGALLAYKTAVLAQKKGLRLPEKLFVSSLKPPLHFNEPVACSSGLADPGDGQLHLMGDEDLKRKLIKNGGIPDIIIENGQIFDFILPTFRNDLKLYETYIPVETVRLPVPIDVFGGNSDRVASRTDLERWSECSEKEITVATFPGGHFYFTNANPIFFFNLSKRLNEILIAVSIRNA